MATQALYRRWRPQTFEDVIGQEHVTQTLRNALATGRVAHAYLFAGPRGTGKTSVARILAKAVNCLAPQDQRPCNECHICRAMSEGSHLDLIEIDAASNTGVDDVRDLREKINFAPNEARQKVYVIDEVHMLSNAAFNALLKTLEEPPAHALFVLATTEPHKIPETIQSRCQRFDFRRVSMQQIVAKLQRICQAEGVDVEPAALEAIARAATGSLRDAESLLDQLLAFADETITLEQVQRLLGTSSQHAVAQLVDHLIAGDAAAGLRLINQVVDEGTDPRQLTRQLLEYLRGLLLLQTGGEGLLNVTAETLERMRQQAQGLSTERLAEVIRRFGAAEFDLKVAAQPQLPLELAFVETALAAGQPARAAQPEPAQTVVSEQRAPVERPAARPREAAPAEPSPVEPAPKVEGEALPVTAEPPTSPEDRGAPVGAAVALSDVQANWEELLATIRPHSRMVEALLKDCRPVNVEGDVVTLGFFYPFHRQRIEEPKNRALVESMLGRILSTQVQVRCVMIDKETASAEVQKRRPKDRYSQAVEDPVIQAAVEKFGARVAGVEEMPADKD
jgi:DNA polymerase-3 subunit gamma/tau